MSKENLLKVGAKTNPKKLASAIVNLSKEIEGDVEVQAVGKAANAQAIKAVAIANNFAKEDGFYFTALPKFVDLEIDGNQITGMRMRLVKHTS